MSRSTSGEVSPINRDSRRLFVFGGIGLAALAALATPLNVLMPASTTNNVAADENLTIPMTEELDRLLKKEYGNHQTVSWDGLVGNLSNAQYVTIGEAHFNPADMITAGEIITEIKNTGRGIAVAVERLSYTYQEQLNIVNDPATNRTEKERILREIFSDPKYNSDWNVRMIGPSGNSAITSQEVKSEFENMMVGLANSGIPIIGVDISHEDKIRGKNTDLSLRNAFWVDKIQSYQTDHPEIDNFVMAVVSGGRHISGDPTSLPGQLKTKVSDPDSVVSIGQRYMVASETAFLKEISSLARKNGNLDVIIKNPEFASAGAFPFKPPDYWIASRSGK